MRWMTTLREARTRAIEALTLLKIPRLLTAQKWVAACRLCVEAGPHHHETDSNYSRDSVDVFGICFLCRGRQTESFLPS
jgi:hypothetical protein